MRKFNINILIKSPRRTCLVNSELSLRLQTNKFGCRSPTEQNERRIIQANPTACQSKRDSPRVTVKEHFQPCGKNSTSCFSQVCDVDAQAPFAPSVTCVDSRVFAYARAHVYDQMCVCVCVHACAGPLSA